MKRNITSERKQAVCNRWRHTGAIGCLPERPNDDSEIVKDLCSIDSGVSPYLSAVISCCLQQGLDTSCSRAYRIASGMQEYERITGKKPFSAFRQMPESMQENMGLFMHVLDRIVDEFGEESLIPSTVAYALTEWESESHSDKQP